MSFKEFYDYLDNMKSICFTGMLDGFQVVSPTKYYKVTFLSNVKTITSNRLVIV